MRPNPRVRNALLMVGALCASALAASPVFPLPESAGPQASDREGGADARTLLAAGVPVQHIPAARSAGGFVAVDLSHALLSTAGDVRYLLTLNRDCPELRWARHVGVTASGNSIWAGFDALTADGQACQIRTIHRLEPPNPVSL